jgi:hypothetical protein
MFKKREIRQAKSKKEMTEGWDVPPRLQGKIVFSYLRKAHHKEALITELTKREALPSTHNPSFTRYRNALKAHEWRREFPSLKLAKWQIYSNPGRIDTSVVEKPLAGKKTKLKKESVYSLV